MMKMFQILWEYYEILWELPKCDTEPQTEQMLLENGIDILAWRWVAMEIRFVIKNTVPVKHNKVKSNEMNARSFDWGHFLRA